MTYKHNSDPAFPLPVADQECYGRFESGYGGMTMRDYFTAKAMQGLLANPDLTHTPAVDLGYKAVVYAEAALAELERQNKQPTERDKS